MTNTELVKEIKLLKSSLEESERRLSRHKLAEHDKRLQKLTELSITLSGEPIDIFKRVAEMIGELLDIPIVCLSEIQGDKLYFLSVYNKGEILTNAGHCPISITPCSTVKDSKDMRIYQNVIEKFPRASFLKTHNAFSYCGFPSIDTEGNVISVTCLLDDKQHEYSDEDKDLLQIFAQRIGTEMERKKYKIERKNAEKLLKSSSDYLQKLNDSLGAVIFTVKMPERVIEYVNCTVESVFGYKPDECIGKKTKILYLSVEEYHDFGRLLKSAIKEGKNKLRVEKLFKRKDGKIIPCEVMITFLREDENIVRVISILHDITERKQMEEDLNRTTRQLSLMLESLPIIPYICKAGGNFGATYVGTEVEKVTGFKPEDFTSNDTFWADRIHPDDASRVFADIPTLFEKGHYEHEYRWQVSDNSYKWFYDVLRLVKLPEETTNQIVGIWLDITERKKGEGMLQEQKKDLERKNIALNEVLGQIEIEKKQIKDNVIANAEKLLLPIIEKIILKEESIKYAQLLRKNLQELTSSFGARLSDKKSKLTSREIDICNMINNGLTSKEIAGLLNISLQTIEKHRSHIRKKLGIVNKKLNLSTVLKTL